VSELPDDVRLPAGARTVYPPVRWADQGVTQGTYEVTDSAASVQASIVSNLLQDGWSTDPKSRAGPDTLIRARKGDRQLSIVMSEADGRTQVLVIETDAEAP
jgi:hypothetical protein